ncbi:MAG: S8 family serine peptidase [Eubacteriales bacterium]|nr:S8 family serine peptidase [Eubacteriales bacterium]
MKKIISAVLAVILCVCCFSVGIIEIGKDVAEKIEFKQVDKLFSEVTSLDGEIENRVVVTCKKELDPRGAVQTASGYDNIQVFQYETKEQAQNALDYYSSLSYVENAEFDRVLTPASDQLLDNYDAKCFATASQGIDDMIKLINENYTDLPEIKVAVIDSGCEENEITSGRVENLGNTSGDDCIHGTKVCGTIVYNTLPNVKVYSYDVGDTNGFSSISAMTAMSKARLQGCKIINMSYGAYETSTSEKNAVNSCYNAGMIMVAASGNDGKELTSDVTHYPSGYSSVFSIGGLTIGRGKASFTNYGVGVDFYAVGTSVRTFYDGADAYWSGTSAATPVVVSVVANLLTADSSLTFSQIKSAIVTKTSYDDVENCPYIDGYATLCALTGKSISQASFTYDLAKNADTGYGEITFHCDDNVQIYCTTSSASALAVNSSKWSK